MNKVKFLISGGGGYLARYLKEEIDSDLEWICSAPAHSDMDVCNPSSIEYFIKACSPDYFIHCAALTRPMIEHEKNIQKSIDVNIVGTANVVKACSKHNLKLIYISTDYVYPGTVGNYTEGSPLLPHNNYAWSKLGGECSVQMYEKSLILRIAMCNYPFSHKKGIVDDKKNWIYDKDVAPIILKLKDEVGIINVGGPPISSYEFGKQINPHIQKITINEVPDVVMSKDTSMTLSRMNSILYGNDKNEGN